MRPGEPTPTTVFLTKGHPSASARSAAARHQRQPWTMSLVVLLIAAAAASAASAASAAAGVACASPVGPCQAPTTIVGHGRRAAAATEPSIDGLVPWARSPALWTGGAVLEVERSKQTLAVVLPSDATLGKGDFDQPPPDPLKQTPFTVTLVVYGAGLADGTLMWLSDNGFSCLDRLNVRAVYNATGSGLSSSSAMFDINPANIVMGRQYYPCVNESTSEAQGRPWISIVIDKAAVPESDDVGIPMPLRIIILIVLLLLSGLFSGLNLGVMALDTNALQIVMESGTPDERRDARVIYPVRKRGNFLLCTLLLGNVLVNNTIAILLGDLTTGLAAVLGSTAAIVVFGEIVPQSACSRHGLKVGAKTIWITRLFMLLTFPASYPISKALDYFLGEEVGTVFKREALKSLLRVTAKDTDLHANEVVILSGALEFGSKTVAQVMTSLQDVFMVSVDSILDYKTMSAIVDNGHSRIPVFQGKRTNIVGLLYFKDLAFVDPDDNIPLKTVLDFHDHELHMVMDDHRLDRMLEEFKRGKSHICIVKTVRNDGPGDPYYEIVGIVTLEDVIEELIQSEINDEYDQISDNRTRQRLPRKKLDYSQFVRSGEIKTKLAPQMVLAAYSYLSSAMPCFSMDVLTESVLKRLIEAGTVRDVSVANDAPDSLVLYSRGKATDNFCLILQGRVGLTVGSENFTFTNGPFTTLAVNAILPSTTQYIPDFSATVEIDSQLLFISRAEYVAAIKAAEIEKAAMRMPRLNPPLELTNSSNEDYTPASKPFPTFTEAAHQLATERPAAAFSSTGGHNSSASTSRPFWKSNKQQTADGFQLLEDADLDDSEEDNALSSEHSAIKLELLNVHEDV
ncbi:cyclin M1 [Capsaspora owczarzaki ATCC 30864]|uniref:Cyclin M1 n=2 Tax=Capsaspora owczarzaki (strain ATCC 30864) TaxID=595528 RepID=A0A0D2VR17_CAPO3|nr:cyclin M1 [Capsaspora owczarzaki ATCC 30864]